MPIQKSPKFSPNVAQRVLKEHGLEGKVSADQLAEAATEFDTKNKGYISGDEFEKAAQQLAAPADRPASGDGAPSGPSLSPLFARGAVIAPPAADLSDPQIAYAKERVLANVGPHERFGELDAGEGLRAFTIDAAALAKIGSADLDHKLKDAGPGEVFGVLSTDDKPSLTIGKSNGDIVRVVGKFDLLDPSVADDLGGGSDPLSAVAGLFGKAPTIALGGENPDWSLASSDWASGKGFKAKKEIQRQAMSARDAARAARRDAADAALLGPTTLDAFAAANTDAHQHTAAEKAALLKLVTDGAGEDKTFPNPDDSYYGLHVFVLEGAAAAHAVAFAQAAGAGPAQYDPKEDSVLVTVKSFDEAQIGTFVVDREQGKVKYGDEFNSVDFSERAVSKFFPDADMDGGYDAFVIGTLTTRGEQLGVVAGSDTPDSMDFTGWLDDA